MIKAIAFDPGKTTGFATGEIDVRDIPVIMKIQTAQAEFTHADLINYLQDYKPNWLITEGFFFRQGARTGLELISKEFIGIFELYCQMNESCTLVMQNPGTVINGHFSNTKLKKLGLYRKPIEGVNQIHANEACAHLMYWYRFGAGHQYGTEFKLKQ